MFVIVLLAVREREHGAGIFSLTGLCSEVVALSAAVTAECDSDRSGFLPLMCF